MRRGNTRRMVLRGTGGLTVSLPLLPSLLPRQAKAQTSGRVPRFVAITTEHGGITRENMYPGAAALTEQASLVDGHPFRHGSLQARSEAGDTVLSAVLRAPAGEFPASLVDKLNVLQGVDIPFYINHHTGGHLGNYARNNGSINTAASNFVPTIDHVIGWSPSFYRDLGSVRERTVYTGDRRWVSWGYSNPQARTGVQEFELTREVRTLFDRLFTGFTAPPAGAPTRPPLIDRVLDSYRRLRTGDRRMSAADRVRLDNHIAALAELDRKLGAAPAASCSVGAANRPPTVFSGDPNAPEADGRRYFGLLNDVLAAALACGVTRVAVIGVATYFHPIVGSWHQDYAHKHREPGPQQVLVTALQRTFRHVFLDLARKLQSFDDGRGGSLLDQTLVMWSQESGFDTHESMSIPIITVGSAGGFFKTGKYVDFRRRVAQARLDYRWAPDAENFAGVPYARWLGTVLHGMGLPRGEWETPGYGGYGKPFGYGLNAEGVDRYVNKYLPAVLQSLSEPLPVIT